MNWILDVDIRSFFDSVSHDWLIRFVEHRIGDPRIIRLMRKWLKAGVLEDGEWSVSEAGTPQGGSRHSPNAKGNFDRLTGHGGDRGLPGRDPAEVLNRRGCNAG